MAKQGLVIGGGASGLTAAIFAARAGAEVTVLDRMPRMGKKILVTGNGRCNLTNEKLDASCYRSDNEKFPMQVLSGFSPADAVAFFRSLGVYTESRQGYVYPRSMQAKTVADALLSACEELGVRLCTEVQIQTLKKTGDCFEAQTDSGLFRGDFLILAAGSCAASKTGSDGSGYALAKGFGHRIIQPQPALVQLRCSGSCWKKVAGVRCDGMVSIFSDGALLASDRGEVQLTDYGISGIPVFQVSRFASRALAEGKQVTASLNFYPEGNQETLLSLLRQQKNCLARRRAGQFLDGLFNHKLAGLFLKSAGISEDDPVEHIREEQLYALASAICGFETGVTAANSFEQAQVCAGGADTKEICPQTMESLRVPGLYFAGELLDVDGICGGYNLHWAWASGALAGKSAARRG